MKKIEHEVKIKSDVATVYQALTTQKGLEYWHSAHISGAFNLNDQFTISHDDHPSFVWKIVGMNPDNSVEWECVTGPGSAPGTHVLFKVSPTNDERVKVECIHDGWHASDENFTKCNTLWGMLLTHLKNFVETGKVKPTFE